MESATMGSALRSGWGNQVSLELKLQSKLQGTWRSHLVQAAEPSIRTASPQAVRQHLGRVAKVGAVEMIGPIGLCTGISKVGDVKDVEGFGAKKEREPLGQLESAADREVFLPSAEPAQGIAPQVPLCEKVRRCCERRRINPLTARVLGAVEIKRLPGHDVAAGWWHRCSRSGRRQRLRSKCSPVRPCWRGTGCRGPSRWSAPPPGGCRGRAAPRR